MAHNAPSIPLSLSAPDRVPLASQPSRLSSHLRTVIGYAGVLAAFLLSLLAPSGEGAAFLWWSLLPAVTLFGFVLITHRVIEGFLWAGLLAPLMVHRADAPMAWLDLIYAEVSDLGNLGLLVLLVLIGGFLGVFEKLGLADSFARAASRLARGPRASGAITAVSSLLLSNDNYLSASGVGVSMAPVNRRYGLPRTFTAAVLRSTGEAGTTLNPIGSSSVLYVSLLLAAGYGSSAMGVYVEVLPFLFYSIAGALIGLLLAVQVIPIFGPLKKDLDGIHNEEAAAEDDGRKLPHFLNFLAPIVTVIVVSFAFGQLQLGFVLALFVTGALLVMQRHTTIAGYVDAVLDGMKEMFSLVLLLALAFVLVGGISSLGFTDFVVDGVSGSIAPQWLPLIIFAIFAATEMLVTLNWSLYILLIPVLVELAVGIDASVPATIAAVISASTFGLASSISSDVGLLTASSTRVPLYRHWITSLPYQLLAACIALIAYAVVGFAGITG